MMNKEAPSPREEVNAPTLIATWEKDLKLADQKRMEKVLQVGEFSPYGKEPRDIQWDAIHQAAEDWKTSPGSFFRKVNDYGRAIDTALRGGRDYGDASERLERVGEYAKIVAIFTAFDAASSKPFQRLLKSKKGDNLSPKEINNNIYKASFLKLIEVINDKFATALGNMFVERLSGKRGYIHEVADKGADTLQVGFKDPLDDLVNGATLESYLRILSQVPIVGALFEQGFTRLANWQERSPLHTATGKAIYMALGIFIRESRATKDAANGIVRSSEEAAAENAEAILRATT